MTPEDLGKHNDMRNPCRLGNFYSDARPLTASQRKKLKKKQQTVEMDEQLAAERAKSKSSGTQNHHNMQPRI